MAHMFYPAQYFSFYTHQEGVGVSECAPNVYTSAHLESFNMEAECWRRCSENSMTHKATYSGLQKYLVFKKLFYFLAFRPGIQLDFSYKK